MYSAVILSTIFVAAWSSPIVRVLESRIIGGKEATPHSIPYQLFLLMTDINNDTFICGASLISPRWVLTAAHCVPEIASIRIYLGAHDISDLNENRTILEELPQKVVVHEEYDRTLLRNDIALIKLSKVIIPDEYIQLMKLPSKLQRNLSQTFVGETVRLAGWGKMSDAEEANPTTLREIQSSIISAQECKAYFHELIQAQHICLSGAGIIGGCSGDSGGPLVVQTANGSVVQIGIASFVNRNSCELGWPTVFARVSHFMDWIENKTGLTFV